MNELCFFIMCGFLVVLYLQPYFYDQKRYEVYESEKKYGDESKLRWYRFRTSVRAADQTKDDDLMGFYGVVKNPYRN